MQNTKSTALLMTMISFVNLLQIIFIFHCLFFYTDGLPQLPVEIVGSLVKTGCFWMIKKSVTDRQKLLKIEHELKYENIIYQLMISCWPYIFLVSPFIRTYIHTSKSLQCLTIAGRQK